MKYLLALSLILLPLFCHRVLAQEKQESDSGVVKTNCGYLLAWNERNNYYTLEINGNDVRQISTEHVQFNVDGAFFQVLTPEIKSFLKDNQKRDPKAILTAHRDWEVKFLEGEYKSKLKVESFPQKLANGEDVLLWQIDIPNSVGTNVLKQTYLTLVKGEHVLMLGSIVTEKFSEKLSHRLLLLTALTLKVGNQPFDLENIQKLLKVK